MVEDSLESPRRGSQSGDYFHVKKCGKGEKMNIIRDEECFGIMMIPLLIDWHIRRCNVKDCTEKPTTIISQIESVPVFGLCEKHYQSMKEAGKIDCKLIFDDFDAFASTSENVEVIPEK
jgi:hypothetical protein